MDGPGRLWAAVPHRAEEALEQFRVVGQHLEEVVAPEPQGAARPIGDAAPVHGWFYRHVPLYAALRCPTRALVMTMLACTVLGAEGLDGIVERLRHRARATPWLVVAGVAFIAGGTIAYLLVGKLRFNLSHIK